MTLSKDVRKLFKDWYKSSRRGRENSNATDRLSESLRFQRRRIWDHDNEGWKEYGFIWFNDSEADEDVQEWFDDNMVIRIYSDYDCTGRPFTFTLDWHRNPNGLVSFVHHILIDC